MKAMKGSLGITFAQLKEMFSWGPHIFFTADTCGGCHKTANVCHGPGWFCDCGHYNILPWSNHQIPHKKPDLGPTRAEIHEAAEKCIVDDFNPGQKLKFFVWDFNRREYVTTRMEVLAVGEVQAYKDSDETVYGAKCRLESGQEVMMTSWDLRLGTITIED